MTEEVREQDGRDGESRRDLLSRGRQRLDVPDTPMLERAQRWMLSHNIQCLHGPETVDYERDELVALVLVRNGRSFVKAFVEHYFSLGVKHLVFLDNGSTDGTTEALKEFDNVTVLRTGVPYKTYNVAMKRYLIERFGRERWTLSLDMDELFDYPYSDVVSLKSLLGYLNDNRYTAVVCYMLDMFSEKPLSEYDAAETDEPLKERYRFYDISEIRTQSYRAVGDIGNVISNEEIEVLQGGVQRKVFHVSPLLTKHCLLFLDGELRPMDLSDHWAGGARVADFTGVLLHYKLSANLYGLVRREIEERRYISRHGKYEKYAKALEESGGVLLRSETSKELKGVSDLVGSRISAVSKQYLEFVESEERRTGRASEERRSERLYEAFFNARSQVVADSKRLRDLERQLADLRSERGERETAARRAHNEQRRLEMRLENELKIQRNLRARAERAEERLQGDPGPPVACDPEREKGGQPEENQRLVQKVHGLERQLEAIRGSRTWRLMEILHRVKARVFGLGKDSP